MAYGQLGEYVHQATDLPEAKGRDRFLSPDHVDSALTIWSKRIALILVGWFASSAYHGVYDLNRKARTLDTVQKVVIPSLKTQVHCEDLRADKTAMVARKAITGALVDAAPVPDPKEIPTDNCPHPAK